jgi:hypothetical protein
MLEPTALRFCLRAALGGGMRGAKCLSGEGGGPASWTRAMPPPTGVGRVLLRALLGEVRRAQIVAGLRELTLADDAAFAPKRSAALRRPRSAKLSAALAQLIAPIGWSSALRARGGIERPTRHRPGLVQKQRKHPMQCRRWESSARYRIPPSSVSRNLRRRPSRSRLTYPRAVRDRVIVDDCTRCFLPIAWKIRRSGVVKSMRINRRRSARGRAGA